MKRNSPLIIGTLLLTIAGIITRIIGFFYRIFLSHVIGAEGLGIYQLIFPVYALCITITCMGIETAISRFTAERMSLKDTASAKLYLYYGLVLSILLSLVCSSILYFNSEYIAVNIILEERCEPLIRLLAVAVPFASVHSCINGFYYGLKKTMVPAISQLLEQVVRVGSVYIVFLISLDNGIEVTPQIAALGIITGEIASALYSATAIIISTFSARSPSYKLSKLLKPLKYNIQCLNNLIKVSIPLTSSRLIVNLLLSYEAIIIPGMLRLYGLSSSEALNVYGILTGMALPLIFFPSAITNSASVMLLPEIAEANASNSTRTITSTIEKTIQYCLLLGIFFTGIFLVYGNDMGTIIFNNPLSGKFVTTLGFICPFLYLTTTISSVLNGLGKTISTLFLNVFTLIIRIIFILYFVPRFGVSGFLWGILVSLLIKNMLCMYFLKKHVNIMFDHIKWILKPILCMLTALSISYLLKILVPVSENLICNLMYLGCYLLIASGIYLKLINRIAKIF